MFRVEDFPGAVPWTLAWRPDHRALQGNIGDLAIGVQDAVFDAAAGDPAAGADGGVGSDH